MCTLSDLVHQGTDIRATTIHHLFDFDGEFTTRLDFTKIDQDKVRQILELQLLMWDEVSMVDTNCWNKVGVWSMHCISISRRSVALPTIVRAPFHDRLLTS